MGAGVDMREGPDGDNPTPKADGSWEDTPVPMRPGTMVAGPSGFSISISAFPSGIIKGPLPGLIRLVCCCCGLWMVKIGTRCGTCTARPWICVFGLMTRFKDIGKDDDTPNRRD